MKQRKFFIASAISILAAATIVAIGQGTGARQKVEISNTAAALFLGSGGLTPSDGKAACPHRGYWVGFPRGTTVKIRISKTVSEPIVQAIREALEDVPDATGGAIKTAVEFTDDPNPMPRRNEVTLTLHPDPVSQGCPYPRGCTMHRFTRRDPGVMVSSRVVQPAGMPLAAYVHDMVGHGVMGMCHIDGNLIEGADRSLMSGGPGVFSGQIAIGLTELDRAAAKALYGSALEPGASRDAFVRATPLNH